MGNISKPRRNVGVQLGLWSVILCMVAGLVMEMRPLIILARSAIAFTVSVMLGHILVSAIQAHSRFQKKLPESEEQDSDADSVESQD